MSTSIHKKVSDKRRDEEYPFIKASYKYKNIFKFYFLPIFSVVIFFLIMIFAIVPNITYMRDQLQIVRALRDESNEYDRRISALNELKKDAESYKSLLEKVNSLVPSEQSEVVKFRQRVAQNGQDNRLIVENQKTGEILVDDSNVVEKTTNFQLIEIPSNFLFKGEFNSLREFLRTMYEGDDFFVISSMDLDIEVIRNVGSIWMGDFDLIKYQFSEDSQTSRYEEVSEFEPINQEVVKFMGDNFGR